MIHKPTTGYFIVSIHAPYAGSDEIMGFFSSIFRGFNPRPLCRERLRFYVYSIVIKSFNPRPLCRERRDPAVVPILGYRFNPRPLCRERPKRPGTVDRRMGFNPRPLCRERHCIGIQRIPQCRVSIHAPYAGSDAVSKQCCGENDVSIHAPYAGSDIKPGDEQEGPDKFQSTPPMQGATI